MKRFQDCNRIIKIWRYRWYLLIPFRWLWFSLIQEFKVYRDDNKNGEWVHTDFYDVMGGIDLWKLLIGDAQIKMKWYHTHEEVMKLFNKEKNENLSS